MPTYLIHGFRWHRQAIRIHLVLQDLEDATPEWIIAPATSISLLNSFYTMFDFLPPSSPPPVDIGEIEAERAVRSERRNSIRVEDLLGKAMNGGGSKVSECVGESEGRPPSSSMRKREPNKLKKKASVVMNLNLSMPNDRRDPTKPVESSESSMNGTTLKLSNGEMTSNKNGAGPQNVDPSRSTTTSAHHPRKSATPIPAFNEWSAIKLLEQHDPDDLTTVSQPWAYVGDHMVEVRLGTSISDEISKYEAKMRRQEGSISSLSMPITPVTPGLGITGVAADSAAAATTTTTVAATAPATTTITTTATVDSSPVLSQRELRRKSRRAGWFEKLRDGLQKEEEVGWHVVVCGDEERAYEPPREEVEEEKAIVSPVRSPVSEKMRGMFRRKKSSVAA